MESSFYCYLTPAVAGGATLHVRGCSSLIDNSNRIFLGSVYKTYQAVNLAKRHSANVAKCPYCMGE
ncbi:hypothetical protein F3J37_21445 [Pantoea sp. Al-1710]|uniref:Uncharacterized protein n=1 Tax=Candidatus Pantoea communis TaxID=2608354 RepID=A0ABX0RUH7_9GAMM|nr:hypothetical protein [Pantoea communis]